MKKISVRRLTVTGMLLAIGMVLPFLTGQIQQIGNKLSPLHLPVFICGMVCGPVWGLALGIVLPLLRSILFGMPPLMPIAAAMAFELAGYGALSGLLRKKLPRTLAMLYTALVASMLGGRVIWGLAASVLYGIAAKPFSLQVFWVSGFLNAVPGIILQLMIVPPIVRALEKAHLSD